MKDRWSQLSMSEKSDLMSLYIQNGISSLEEIKKHYNSFATGGQMNTNGPDEPLDSSSVNQVKQLSPVNVTSDLAQNWINSWMSGRKDKLYNNYMGSRNLFQRIGDFITGNQHEGIEEEILSDQINGMSNMEQYVSDNPLEVYAKENPDYRVKQKDLDAWEKGETLAETFHKSNRIYYNPSAGIKFDTISGVPLTIRVHENTHALADSVADESRRALTPQEKIIDRKYLKYFLEPYDEYLSKPNEIYSRLMELRFQTGLKPDDKVNWDWYIENKDKIQKLHLLFDENKIIDLLNEVAQSNDNIPEELNFS